MDTVRRLPAEMRNRVQRNLLVGLALDQSKEEFRCGDFLIRNLIGVHQGTGALAMGALPKAGQTLQFQLRDPEVADEVLRAMLERAKAELGEWSPGAALLFCCNGRGVGLFGMPDTMPGEWLSGWCQYPRLVSSATVR